MRVQTDFKNTACLKFLKTVFAGKIPRFSFKKMSPDWLNDVTLLDIVPGTNVRINSAALYAYI